MIFGKISSGKQESAKSIEPDAPSIKLSQEILEEIIDKDVSPTDIAIDFIKKELKEIF